jgi:hypothetical protein
MHQEYFSLGSFGITRNEALRVLIAAIYNTARERSVFTTDHVFQKVTDYPVEALRKATATSKLIAVALRKATRRGICTPATEAKVQGDLLCHGRPKGLWVSKIASPVFSQAEGAV